MNTISDVNLAKAKALRALADALEAVADAIEASSSAVPDHLVAFPFGLEARAARTLVQSGELLASRIGRRWYTKNSYLLALADRMPMSQAGDRRLACVRRDDDYARIVEQVRVSRKK